ncbi:hypothetical protein [Acidithiobacillus ferrivorans]|nr:hypothetical protein [Acidithiobacillus ferrivorans]
MTISLPPTPFNLSHVINPRTNDSKNSKITTSTIDILLALKDEV